VNLWNQLKRDPMFWILTVLTVALFADVIYAALKGIYS
jgi:hypothetical protein